MSGIHARCRDRSIDRNVERDEACACLASEHTLSRKRVNVSLQACNSRSRHENCTEESAASRCMTPVAGRDIHMRVHAGFEPMSAWKANAVECRVPRMDLASSNRCNAKQDMQAVDLSTLHRDTGNGAGVRNARAGERSDSGVGGESGTHSAHPCASVRPAQMRGRSTASGSAARTPRLALRAASPCGSALLPIRRTVGSSSSPPTPPDTHNARARRALCVSGGESGIHSAHPCASPCGRLRRADRHSCRSVEPLGPHQVRPHRQIRTTPARGGRCAYLAERVGFEPTEGLTLRRFSRPVP